MGGGSSSFQELPQGLSSQSSLSWVQVWPSTLATDRARLLPNQVTNQMTNLNLKEAGAERKSVSVATPANTQTLPLGSDLGRPGQWGGALRDRGAGMGRAQESLGGGAGQEGRGTPLGAGFAALAPQPLRGRPIFPRCGYKAQVCG